MSRHASLTDQTILDAVTLCDTTWGARWADKTRFAVLDIDETSQYHNELGLARLRHLLASVGFDQPQNYQSSDSGGWHLYLFFSDWVNCAELQNLLRQWLIAEGLQIKQGQLELFPSNNGLRLPLQKGFAWLDEKGAVTLRREELSADQAIARFTDALDANAHNWHTVRNGIRSRLAEIESAGIAGVPADRMKRQDAEEDGFSEFFTEAGKIQEVYNSGREYWQNGLTAPSQRHHAIICIGHYLWYGDENEGVRALPGVARADQRAAVIEAWLKEKHNGFSKSVLRGDWKDVGADIQRACNWEASEGAERQRSSYPLTDRLIDRLEGLTKKTGRLWYPNFLEKGNIGREERAREQIRLALAQLLAEGRRISVRGLERVSGCRKETIKRHIDIWGAFRLSNGLGDLSFRGVPVVVLSESVDNAFSNLSDRAKVLPEVVGKVASIGQFDATPEKLLNMVDNAERSIERSNFQLSSSINFDILQAWKQDRTELLATATTPILPRLDFENTPNLKAADLIAGDGSARSVLPSLTIDGLEIAQREPKLDPKFKDKGDAEAGVDRETARRLSQVLPNLAGYSERHSGIGPKLIAAIMRNEHSYHGVDDSIQDAIVSKTGNAIEKLPKGDFTIGPGQVKLSNIRDLQHKYEHLFGDVSTSDLSRMATDKTFGTALVAAYLDDRAKTLESWSKHPPDVTKLNTDEKLLYKFSLPLWKSGQETKALISSFNPGDGSSHIKNVLRQMDLIDQGH